MLSLEVKGRRFAIESARYESHDSMQRLLVHSSEEAAPDLYRALMRSSVTGERLDVTISGPHGRRMECSPLIVTTLTTDAGGGPLRHLSIEFLSPE